ncbi:hypothetical protein OROHE_011027 [Orobanche hederae]
MSSSRGKRQASPNDQSEENKDHSAWYDPDMVNYSIAETPQCENCVNDLTSVINGFHISDSEEQGKTKDRVVRWSQSKGKWVSEIRIPGSEKRIGLGTYKTHEEAARAHNKDAKKYKKDKAIDNISGSYRPIMDSNHEQQTDQLDFGDWSSYDDNTGPFSYQGWMDDLDQQTEGSSRDSGY